MLKVIFLLSTFIVDNQGHTITNITIMPDMDTCNKAKIALMQSERHEVTDWIKVTKHRIDAPIDLDCVEK